MNTNECVAAGCKGSCCGGQRFVMAPKQFASWIKPFEHKVKIKPSDYKSELASLRKDGTPIVYYLGVIVGGCKRVLVLLNGLCAHYNCVSGDCGSYGEFDACNELQIGGGRCNDHRVRDNLPLVNG